MEKTLKEWIAAQPDGGREFAQERLIVAVAELICDQLNEQGKSKAELAAALGKSKSYVTQVLDGTRNMTLRTLSDIAFALGLAARVSLRDTSGVEYWQFVHRLPDRTVRKDFSTLVIPPQNRGVDENASNGFTFRRSFRASMTTTVSEAT